MFYCCGNVILRKERKYDGNKMQRSNIKYMLHERFFQSSNEIRCLWCYWYREPELHIAPWTRFMCHNRFSFSTHTSFCTAKITWHFIFIFIRYSDLIDAQTGILRDGMSMYEISFCDLYWYTDVKLQDSPPPFCDFSSFPNAKLGWTTPFFLGRFNYF